MEIKRLVIKWQRALVTPFRNNAPALEAVPLQPAATVLTGKRTIRPANVTEKGNNINTVNLLFEH